MSGFLKENKELHNSKNNLISKIFIFLLMSFLVSFCLLKSYNNIHSVIHYFHNYKNYILQINYKSFIV
jgi:hypothetical protein